MTVLWPTLILLASVVILGADEASTMICAFSKKDIVKNRRHDSAAEDDTGNYRSLSENIVYSNSTEYCVKDSDSCYALWQEDPVNKSITILTQGCWDSSGDANCEASECIANKKPSKALNNSKFCCCSGNFCNVNVTDGYVYVPESPTAESKPPSTFGKPGVFSSHLAIFLIVLTALVCLVTAGSFAYRFYWSNHKRSSDSLHLMEAPPPPSPAFDLDSLNSQEIIGCGRYGSVYRGTLHDHTVAIKIFAYQNRQYFYNERDIYTLPHMDHPDLLKYIGSGERIGADERPEYLLVLSYTPIGSLHSFVSSNTFDWGHLCKMALSVTQGLAQLHTEIRKGDVFKPCIAHRDLTSRNILVKANGSCMLCDFGFAIRIAGSKYYQNGEEQIAETTSLADVGTLRYMAPEILEGAVNLRDCEASLKQIDVYALGLVLWEIATRCSDLFQGMEVPDYKLPFEAEIGIHPTMEQMQVLVTRHKARPLFPDIWKDTNPAVRALKETIEDCWDQDAEARLTTSCVKERLSELPVLWERHKAGLGVPGVSPTVNLTSNHQKPFSVNQTYVTENSLTSEVLNNGTDLQPCSRERIGSLSEATTVTLLSPSESLSQSSSIGNPAGNIKNCIANNSAHASRVSVPLQPHQGRNPCLERNLMMEPLDEVSISGNTFLERPSKLAMNGRISSFSDGDTDIFDYVSLPDNTESNYLVSGDLLSHSSRVCNPIPYVQNAVHLASTIPKQPNVPGNGHSLNAQEESKAKENKHWGPLNFFDKKRSKDSFRAGLKSLLERKSHSENRTLSEEQQPLKGFSAGNGYSPNTPCVMGGKLGQTNPINCYWASEDNKELERLVDTEVRILKSDCSSTLVRPVNNLNVEEKDEFIKPMEKITDSKSNTPVKDISNPDVIESSAHVEEKKVPADKTKRPTSLPVQGYPNGSFEDKDNGENSDYEDGKLVLHNTVDNNPVVTMRRKGSSGKRKGVKRVKTPFEIKGRFSLYDDRIMSSQELPSSQGKVVQQPQWDGVTKFSASVPMGMNILCSSQSSNSVQINRMHLNKLQQISKTNGLKLPVSRDQHQTVHSLCDI